jgi:hypothetical protein
MFSKAPGRAFWSAAPPSRPEFKALFREASAAARRRVVKVETRQVYREDDDQLVNIPAGERVLVVERPAVAALADEIALDDFILFDDQLAFANIYSRPKGVPGGANLIRDPDYLAGFAKVAEALTEAAVPFADFPLPPMARPLRATTT